MRLLLRKMLLIVLVVCFVVGIQSILFALNEQDLFGTNSGVILRAETDRMIYNLDQQIEITAYLKNKTDEPINIVEPAIDKTSFMVEIVDPDGKKDKLIDIGVNLKTIRLYPDKRIKFKTKFIPEMAGNYDIQVKYFGYEETLSTIPIRVFVVSAPLTRIQPDD